MQQGMSLECRQQLLCTLCGREWDDHKEVCPYDYARKLNEIWSQHDISCMICHGGKLHRNIDDFFECRQCSAQYSTGLPGSEGKKRYFLIDYAKNETYTAHLLPDKGKRSFPLDRQMRVAKKAIEVAQYIAKRRRKPIADFKNIWAKAHAAYPESDPKSYRGSNPQELERLTKIFTAEDESFE